MLQGLSFDSYKPKVLIVENLFDEAAYLETMEARGYTRWARLHPNDVYVRKGFRGTGANRLWMPWIEKISGLFRRR